LIKRRVSQLYVSLYTYMVVSTMRAEINLSVQTDWEIVSVT